MEYQHYTTLDFVLDENFQKWVLSPDEGTDSFWDTWLLQHPEKLAEVTEAKKLIHLLEFKTDVVTEQQRQKMLAHILNAVQQESVIHPLVSKPQREWNTYWLRIAAALLVGALAISGIAFWYLNRQISYHTQYGEISVVVLPDQTKVTLNAHSSLTFDRNWRSDQIREVWLEGEAFFEVRKKAPHNPSARFQVHTKDLTVEVLGTRFNVTKRDEQTAVSLNEGKIQIDLKTPQPTKNIVMKPGEMVKFSKSDQKIEKNTIQADAQSSWVKNYWVLKNTTLAEIAKRIEITYGYNVSIVNEQLLSERITGVLPTHTIKNLLDVLSTTYNVKISFTNNQVTISK